MAQITDSAASLPVGGHLPSLGGATEWLNSPPLSAADVRGKVVVVSFCTYTCINWIRSLPYVRAWAERYRDRGLVVIGVHTPEFTFEKDVENVRGALGEMRVEYPIAIDNSYTIWDAFANRYWPALYFIDARGRIRHHRFGEGDYDRSEFIIQQLLADAGVDGIGHELVSVDARGPEAPADWDGLESPEMYLGYRRAQNFESSGNLARDEHRVYADLGPLERNHWALSGDWTATAEAIVLNEPNGRIACAFHARDVHLVMGPATREASVRFRVLVDGHPPGAACGSDVDARGSGLLVAPRMYQLIRQEDPIVDRLLEIEFLDPGAAAFVLTFG